MVIKVFLKVKFKLSFESFQVDESQAWSWGRRPFQPEGVALCPVECILFVCYFLCLPWNMWHEHPWSWFKAARRLGELGWAWVTKTNTAEVGTWAKAIGALEQQSVRVVGSVPDPASSLEGRIPIPLRLCYYSNSVMRNTGIVVRRSWTGSLALS